MSDAPAVASREMKRQLGMERAAAWAKVHVSPWAKGGWVRRNRCRCTCGDSRGGGSGRGTALEEAQGEAGREVDSSISYLRDRCIVKGPNPNPRPCQCPYSTSFRHPKTWPRLLLLLQLPLLMHQLLLSPFPPCNGLDPSPQLLRNASTNLLAWWGSS